MAYEDILNNLKQTPPRELNDHILIIDAMNMLIRSFSLLKAMNPSGTHIGGLVGFLRSLGYDGHVKSPTFTLIEYYDFESYDLFHIDLFRINNANELDYLGLDANSKNRNDRNQNWMNSLLY